MGVVGQRRSRRVEDAPPARCVQDNGHADLRAQALGIGRDGHDRFSRGAEQEAIDRLLVPVCNAGDLGWQGEDDVEIHYRQKIFGPRRHPVARRRTLAFGAVPVLATVVRNVLVAARDASRYMPAERLSPADLYRRHWTCHLFVPPQVLL